MKLYPLFADLSGRPVLVVGGGVVGERKASALLEAGAQVIVGAPELTPALRAWVLDERVQWLHGSFEESRIDGVWLVIAATSDTGLHRQIAALAEARRVFVNVVDDAEASSFHVPAVIDRSPVTIAISSGGHAPMLARLLRERLEVMMDPVIGSVASLLAQMRHRIRARRRMSRCGDAITSDCCRVPCKACCAVDSGRWPKRRLSVCWMPPKPRRWAPSCCWVRCRAILVCSPCAVCER